MSDQMFPGITSNKPNIRCVIFSLSILPKPVTPRDPQGEPARQLLRLHTRVNVEGPSGTSCPPLPAKQTHTQHSSKLVCQPNICVGRTKHHQQVPASKCGRVLLCFPDSLVQKPRERTTSRRIQTVVGGIGPDAPPPTPSDDLVYASRKSLFGCLRCDFSVI